MARPLRIEFPGAVYHVTSRGARQESIFVDEDDYRQFLAVIEQGLERFDAQMLAYSLMDDHYEFVLFTRSGHLSRLMRHINGVYTQAYNRRHGKGGHLMQGRFKAVLVDRDAYLLDVCRYVEYNPVRVGWVKSPGAWAWSSHQAHVGDVEAPAWLETEGLLSYVLGKVVKTPLQRQKAQAKYAELVKSARGLNFWETGLRHQIFLGDESFAKKMLAQAKAAAKRELVSKSGSAKALAQWLQSSDTREEGLRRAYVDGGMTMTSIAADMGVTVARVSQLIAKAEAALLLPEGTPPPRRGRPPKDKA